MKDIRVLQLWGSCVNFHTISCGMGRPDTVMVIQRWTCNSEGRRFDSRPCAFKLQPWASCSHTCASVTKQYNLLAVKGR